MKLTPRKSDQGSTLVLTVISSALIGTVLSSYLVLTSARNQAAMRAMAWNTAIPVLEAGIEESLSHFQLDMNNPTANSWTQDQVNGQPVYWKYRMLPDGSYYFVTNFNVGTSRPYIHSAGYVRLPLKENDYLSRLVEVQATNTPSVFGKAIAANGMVMLSGGSVVDGYDSSLGPYDPNSNRNASGGIATDSTQQPAINVGSAHLYGTAVTGPGGTVSVAGGTVGDLAWSSGNTGIESGWMDDNMNVSFASNSPPAETMPAPATTVSGPSNILYLTTGTYELDSFNSNTKLRPMIVSGDVTLYVPGDFIVSGSPNNAGYVYISPNASLKLYVGGSASISGAGVVNATGKPANFSYYGLPSNTTLTYSGSAAFVGTINAPQAAFGISGGASVFGAVICNTFASGGGSSVHYDQSLNGGGKFLVTSWTEL